MLTNSSELLTVVCLGFTESASSKWKSIVQVRCELLRRWVDKSTYIKIWLRRFHYWCHGLIYLCDEKMDAGKEQIFLFTTTIRTLQIIFRQIIKLSWVGSNLQNVLKPLQEVWVSRKVARPATCECESRIQATLAITNQRSQRFGSLYRGIRYNKVWRFIDKSASRIYPL